MKMNFFIMLCMTLMTNIAPANEAKPKVFIDTIKGKNLNPNKLTRDKNYALRELTPKDLKNIGIPPAPQFRNEVLRVAGLSKHTAGKDAASLDFLFRDAALLKNKTYLKKYESEYPKELLIKLKKDLRNIYSDVAEVEDFGGNREDK
jgi:hypothetical protein